MTLKQLRDQTAHLPDETEILLDSGDESDRDVEAAYLVHWDDGDHWLCLENATQRLAMDQRWVKVNGKWVQNCDRGEGMLAVGKFKITPHEADIQGFTRLCMWAASSPEDLRKRTRELEIDVSSPCGQGG